MESGPGARPVLRERRTKLSSDIVNGAEQSIMGEELSGMSGREEGAFQTFSARYSAKVVAR